VQDFKRLRVWHLARDLALRVIEAIPQGVSRRVPGLRSQVIRAATSVAANVAEGCTRSTRSEFLHFVEIALGSLNEVEGHLILARDADVLKVAVHARLQRRLELLRRMIVSLMRTLQRHIAAEESRRLAAKAPPVESCAEP
jgi:four helix bundle protein